MQIPYRVLLWILVINLFALASSCQAPKEEEIPDSLKEFSDHYLSLHDAYQPDIKAIRGIFHWDGVDPDLQNTILQSFLFDIDTPIEELSFVPWDSERDSERFFPENTRPNLDPVWIMQVEYDAEPRLQLKLLVGEFDGSWKILNPILQDD